MNVKTLISILQKEVKPADRENANIEIWCGDQEYDIESMNGFSFSPDIVIKLEKTVTPALQPLKFKNEHKEKVAGIKKENCKNLESPLNYCLLSGERRFDEALNKVASFIK